MEKIARKFRLDHFSRKKTQGQNWLQTLLYSHKNLST